MKQRKGKVTAHKRNAGAAQLAVLGLVGAGSAVAMGRGYLAERRTRALDRELLAALARYRLAPDTRLSPPVGGLQDAPRLRDLANPDTLTFEHDPRKRELFAQAHAGEIHVGRDRRGVAYLARPGQPPVEVEFSRAFERRKHNGAVEDRVESLRRKLQRETHGLADVAEGRVPVGVEGRGGRDVPEARERGLFVVDVPTPAGQRVTLFSRSRASAAPMIRYLSGGGMYGTPEFSRLLGYSPAEIDSYREFLVLSDKHDLLEHDVRRGYQSHKRNDASRPSHVAHAAPWAFAQYDDARTGSWGVAINGAAELYRYDGARWQPAGATRWNASRGRLEGAAPAEVLAGLSRAVLDSPVAREALREHLAGAITRSFKGERPGLPGELSADARRVVQAAANVQCLSARTAKARPGTKAARELSDWLDRTQAVARLALTETCGDGDAPVAQGSACDLALDALAHTAPSVSCALEAPPCPRRVSADVIAAWRAGGMPAVGPYETAKAHAMGADPCCLYHPATQARLALRQRVEAHLRDEVGSAAWLRAVEAAELDSPLYATWAACDLAMQRKVDALESVTGEGVGGAGAFLLLQYFYEATMRGDYEAQAEAYGRARKLLGELPPLDELAELDSAFWDLAKQEARESGNLGYKRWVQTHGGKAGRTVFKRFDRASGVIR